MAEQPPYYFGYFMREKIKEMIKDIGYIFYSFLPIGGFVAVAKVAYKWSGLSQIKQNKEGIKQNN